MSPFILGASSQQFGAAGADDDAINRDLQAPSALGFECHQHQQPRANLQSLHQPNQA